MTVAFVEWVAERNSFTVKHVVAAMTRSFR